MHAGCRLLLLATATLTAVAAAPSRAENAAPSRPTAPTAIAGSERWRLRPAPIALPGPATTGSLRTRPATAIPDERRTVRVVYPAQ